MNNEEPITRTFGHGSITLTYHPSSGRIGVNQTGLNAVMEAWEMARFVQECEIIKGIDDA